jgi:two-component system chemotaxis sensor kinase CheA
LSKIKTKAVEKGLYSEDELNNLSDQEILNLIFKDGFSTKDDVSQLSGRGLGLSVVKNEVDKLYGSVEVKTKQGKGTEFQFILPYEPSNFLII